jgi:integrase/recombinase XerD
MIAPEWNRDWLTQLYRTLRAKVRPAREKLSRLKPIDELTALGERLMEEADSASDWSAKRRAVAYRDGLMIALLTYRPIRCKNLAMMRIGRHLIKVRGSWQILFVAEETKSHVPYEAILPSALTPRLERYLDVHRPVLIHGEQVENQATVLPAHPELDALWVSERGTQLNIGILANRIVVRTKAAFGQSVSPHLFRDCAATSIAVDNPKNIGDASLVLGHVGHTMTEKHYNHAQSLEASRKHAATAAHGFDRRSDSSLQGEGRAGRLDPNPSLPRRGDQRPDRPTAGISGAAGRGSGCGIRRRGRRGARSPFPRSGGHRRFV